MRRILVVIVFLVGGCAASGTATPPPAGIRPDGFPTGVFAKEFDDPFFGRMRLSWVFSEDGAWAEVPEALDGQSMETGPARGRYLVNGDRVTLEVDLPTFWGWTEHTWSLNGDVLTTTFEDSELPQEAEFFAILDEQPWHRAP